MAMNVGRAVDMIELMCKNVDPLLSSNPELIRQLLNMKQREFAAETGVMETTATIASVADQQEYQLPADCLHVSKVIYDDYTAHKITFDKVEELKGTY